jgi:mono/diheme cytochrome c family protein
MPRAAASPAPVQPTFSSLETNVFTPKCVQCHGSSNPSAGVDLSSYAAIQNAASTHGHAIIEPGNPDASHLYMFVADGSMPPDNSAPKVTADELAALRAWIQAGAQNN